MIGRLNMVSVKNGRQAENYPKDKTTKQTHKDQPSNKTEYVWSARNPRKPT